MLEQLAAGPQKAGQWSMGAYCATAWDESRGLNDVDEYDETPGESAELAGGHNGGSGDGRAAQKREEGQVVVNDGLEENVDREVNECHGANVCLEVYVCLEATGGPGETGIRYHGENGDHYGDN